MPRARRFKVGGSSTPQTQDACLPTVSKDSVHQLNAQTKSSTRVHLISQTSGGSHSHSLPPTHCGSLSPAHGGSHSHSLPQAHHGSSLIPSNQSIDLEAENVESFDEHVDNLFSTSENTSSTSRKKDYWIVQVIDDDFQTKEAHLKVQDVWTIEEGRKIILLCNEFGQAIGDAGGLLGGFLGTLGIDFSKFPICYSSWHKVPKAYKDSVYDEIIKKFFLITDDRLKDNIMKRIGKVWKDARHDLFHNFYTHTLSLEENIAKRPAGIDENHWRLFLEYRLSEKTQEICLKNTENRMKQLYTHIGGSKSIARRKDEEEKKRGGSISRGELWVMLHKKKDGSYIHDDAQVIGEKIMNIENQDNSSKEISKNDSLSQALGKEHSCRVRGVGSGPCPTQLFGQTTYQFGGSSHAYVIQSEMNDVKSQLEAERLKRKNLEEIVEAERMKRLAVESAVKYILQLQGGNLPSELAAMISTVGQDEGSGPISPGARPSSSASHDAQRQSK